MICLIPGLDVIKFTPFETPPTWSCHPPPVVVICSIASTLLYKSFSFTFIPKNSETAFVQAKAKIEVLPNPEPFGVSTISELRINPEPKRSKISFKSTPVFGIIPHTNKHAFCKEKGSKGHLHLIKAI